MADDLNHETKKNKKKHKKKHKRQDESKEEDTAEMEDDNSKEVQQPSTPIKSPPKQKVPEQKMAVKRYKVSHREWSLDEEDKLLKEVEKFALSCKEKNPKFVNWSQIEVEGFTPAEIKEQYQRLTKKVRKFRTVGEVVADAQLQHKEKIEQSKNVPPKNARDKGPPKPMNSFMLFCKAKRASLVEKHPKLTFGEIHKKMCERWKELPDTKREKYSRKFEKAKRQYLEQLEQYQEKRLQGVKKPLSAFDMWKLEREADEKNDNEIEADYVVEWDNLPNSMKKGWLQAATSEKERYESEVSHITNKKPKKKKNAESVDPSTSDEPGNSSKKTEVPNDNGQSSPSKEKSNKKRHLDTSNKSHVSPSKKVKQNAKNTKASDSTESD